MNSHIKAQQLSCHRGQVDLFEPVSFELFNSQSLLISGVNGIGKSTLLESIVGLRSFAKGEIILNDQNILDCQKLWHESILYLGHKSGHKRELTCIENLSSYMGALEKSYPNSKFEEALEKIGLSGYEYQLAGQLSAGQYKRLSLARLLLTEKKIWILDEPFVNLDKQGCSWLLELLKAHLEQAGMLILTAHDQLEVKSFVDSEIELQLL